MRCSDGHLGFGGWHRQAETPSGADGAKAQSLDELGWIVEPKAWSPDELLDTILLMSAR